MNSLLPLQLQAIAFHTESFDCQTLTINLLKPTELISPNLLDALELPPELDLNREVILFGRAPTWLYAHLVDRCKQAPWVGCYAIQLKAAVVVSSRVASPEVGDVVPIVYNNPRGAAILIGGPPNSGKSVLSNALRCSLQEYAAQTRVYLHRANWDGEGNWTHETPDRDVAKKLTDVNEHKIHLLPNAERLIAEYFSYHADATKNIRDVVDVALVDVGGMPQPAKMPVVEQCSHYIAISRYPEKVQEWHALCGEKLQLLAVIHSVLESRCEIINTEPYLEIVAGPWITRETLTVPKCLLDRVVNLLPPL